MRSPAADFVVLDQNLHYRGANGDEVQILGTDVARRLRDAGYEGVLCIMTASSSDNLHELTDGDSPRLTEEPGVDFILAKNVSLKKIAEIAITHINRRRCSEAGEGETTGGEIGVAET